MASNFVCPSCQKRLNVRSDLQGRSVRCPACQAKVVVQLDAPVDPFVAEENELFPPESPPEAGAAHSPYEQLAADLLTRGTSPYAAGAPTENQPATQHQATAKPVASPYASGRHVAKPKAASEDEDNLPLFVRIGGFMMVIAVLSMILPFFGLQIKGLHLAGEAGSQLGLMLGLLGAAIVGGGYLVSGNIVACLLTGVVPAVMLVAFAFGLGLTKGGAQSDDNRRLAQSQSEQPRQQRQLPPSSFQPPITGSSVGRFGPTGNGSSRTTTSTTTTKTTPSPFQNVTPSTLSRTTSNLSGGVTDPSTSSSAPPANFKAPEPGEDSGDKGGFAKDDDPGDSADSFGEFDRSSRAIEAMAERRFSRARNLGDLMRRQMDLESDLGMKLANNFPPEFLTKVVGRRDTREAVLVHPERKPVIGLDYAVGAIDESELAAMVPVFWESEESQITAKEGYAVAGMNLNAEDKIIGFQVIFMKLAGKSYDTSDSYVSDWHGVEPADGKGVTLGGDGRPVYGIVTHGFNGLTGIQLVIEPAKKNKK